MTARNQNGEEVVNAFSDTKVEDATLDNINGQIYIKKAKSYYTFKAGKYSCKMSYGKYVKLITAKNNKKYRAFAFVVGKQYGIYPIHMAVNTLPKDMQSKKGDYENIHLHLCGFLDNTAIIIYYQLIPRQEKQERNTDK